MERSLFGLRARLLLLVLLATVPILGLIGYTALEQLQRDAAAVQSNAVTLVRLAAREQERLVFDTRQLLVALSELPQVRSPLTGRSCASVLARIHKSFPYYTNIGVADLRGNVFCSSHPTQGRFDISDRDYFRRAVDDGSFGIGNYQIGRITGTPAINFGYPVRDDDGKPVAVVYAALSLRWIEELLATATLPPGSVLTVIDDRGTVIATHPHADEWIGKSLPSQQLAQAMLSASSIGTIATKGLDGVTGLYAYAALLKGARSNLYVSVGIPEDVAFAQTRRDMQRNAALLLLVMVLALLAAWFGGDAFVIRRAAALVTASDRLGKGDLSARTGLPHGGDELGRVARSFDGMAASLQRAHRALKTLSMGNRALVRVKDEDALLAEICRIIVEVGGYRFAWVGYASDDPDRTVRPVAQYGYEGGLRALSDQAGRITWADEDRGRGPMGTAIRTGARCVVRNTATDPNFKLWRTLGERHGYAAVATFPLRVQDQVIGGLAIYSRDSEAFDAEELQLLEETADDLAFGVATARTRSAHERARATIADMSRYDRLTGLLNQAYFEERLSEIVTNLGATRTLALLIVDPRRLREINEAFGYARGDAVLRSMSARIRSEFAEDVLVARVHGNRLALLIPTGRTGAANAARRIFDILRAPFVIGDLQLEFDVAIGGALFPDHGAEAPLLLRNADIAMQQTKKTGEEYLLYEVDFESDSRERLEMASALRRGIEAGQLVLHYQAKVNMANGQLAGAEALVRWDAGDRLIPPDAFIPLAEQTGLIKPLAEYVFDAALRQSAAWRREGLAIPIAVNLSARNFRDPALVQKIQTLLRSHNADGTWLELEITESTVMEDPEGALDKLKRLKTMGIRLYIDDFGTGYSSMGSLKKLPVDAVKIDKSFVIGMLKESDSASIVRSTIGLAHDLGLGVVAEGVETQSIWRELRTLGCDTAQGYYISKPCPAEQLQAWIKTRR